MFAFTAIIFLVLRSVVKLLDQVMFKVTALEAQ